MKILQLNTVFNGGGTDNQTIELCQGLRARGHDVSLAVRAGCDWEEHGRSLGLPLVLLSAEATRKILRLPRLIRYVRAQRFDIIHAHQGRDFWPAMLAGRLAGRRTHVVITRHLMTCPRRMSRQFLLRLSDVVAVSKAVQGVLDRELRGPRTRLHQIYCGIDTAKFRVERTENAQAFRKGQGWDGRAVVFGIIGRYGLPRGKGHLEFLEAAAGLTRDFSEMRLAIVGEGSMRPLLQERLHALGLEKVATLVPFTTNMPSVMQALDVVVHPATGSDAFPLVVLEGMASGKPVIASNLDGIPEQFHDREQGLLVPPADVPALTEVMRTLLREPGLRLRMGAAGRERVCQNFTTARQTERYESLYQRIVAAPAHRV